MHEHTAPALVLPFASRRALVAHGALLAAALLLPAAAHAAALPVRWLLPMHWPVLVAALVYGWRGGALVGALAPVLAHAVSGHPLPLVLPAMTLELATYGLVAGALREGARTSGFVAVAAAVVAGRLVFVAIAFATDVARPFALYLEAALLPGLAAAAAQIALIPPLAKLWVGGGRR